MRTRAASFLLVVSGVIACGCQSPSAPTSERATFVWEFGPNFGSHVLAGGEGNFAVGDVPGGVLYKIMFRSTVPAVRGRLVVAGFTADALFRGVYKSEQTSREVSNVEDPPSSRTMGVGWTYETTCVPGTYVLTVTQQESGGGMSGAETKQATISVTVLPQGPGGSCNAQGR